MTSTLKTACVAFVTIFSSLVVEVQITCAVAWPRLPRSGYDVIAPSDRVAGPRGSMGIVQPGCRIGQTADARRRIVNVAVQEWGFFGFQVVDARQVDTHELPMGLVSDALNPVLPAPRIQYRELRFGMTETSPAADSTIGGYWSATPDGAAVLGKQNLVWRGGGAQVGWVMPWSAAFVSWVMCESGLGDPKQFQRSIAHRDYIDQAIRARDGQEPYAAYVAYDPGEQPIEPGDLLCNTAGGPYRSLADRRHDAGTYKPAHCEIVVKATDAEAFVVGGNVLQSVSLTILPLTKEETGSPHPVAASDVSGVHTVFAHLKLRATSIEADALDQSPTIRSLTAK